MNAFADWSWSRPWGLLALLLPLVLLLLSLRPERPVACATGTFELWRGLGGPTRGRRRARHVPLSRLLLVLSLIAGALALAGPHERSEQGEERWLVVVDRSPSCFLPAPGQQRARVEVAAERLARWLAKRPVPARTTWLAETLLGEERRAGETLPREWLEAPPVPLSGPVWERFDRPGVLFLTDVLAMTPEAAGLFASGAEPVPGPVSDRVRERLVFDGRGVRREPRAPRWVRVDELPDPLAEFVELWAEDRALCLAIGADAQPPAGCASEPPALWIRGVTSATNRRLVAGRAGWRLVGRGALLPAILADAQGHLRQLEPWVMAGEAGDGAARPRGSVVARAAGVLAVGFIELEEPEGDPAAFALSWSSLLDESLAPAPDVLPLGQRQLEGAPREVAPAAPASALPRRGAPAPGTPTAEMLLAGACALLAVSSRLLRGS